LLTKGEKPDGYADCARISDRPTARADAWHVAGLQKQQLIAFHDAAIVTWPANKAKTQTKQLNNIAGFGALNGASGACSWPAVLCRFSGRNRRRIVRSPARWSVGHWMTTFIKQVEKKVKPGTSAPSC